MMNELTIENQEYQIISRVELAKRKVLHIISALKENLIQLRQVERKLAISKSACLSVTKYNKEIKNNFIQEGQIAYFAQSVALFRKKLVKIQTERKILKMKLRNAHREYSRAVRKWEQWKPKHSKK